MRKSRIIKLALSLYFILIAVVVLQLRNSAVEGYELSIYTNTPPLTWVLVIGGIITGLVIIVREVMGGARGNRWLLGFFMLGVSVFIICALPTLRGYHLYNPVDPLGHLSMAQAILSTGHIDPTNTYPLLHILLAETAVAGKAPLMLMIKYIPVLMSLLFMVYTYMLASLVLPKRGMALLAAAATTTLLFDFFQVSPYPQGLATMTLPLIFYLYFKRLQSPYIGYRVAFVILLIGYVFSHAHTVIILLVFLVIMEVLGKGVLDRFFTSRAISQLQVPAQTTSMTYVPVMILLVTFFIWISGFTVFDDRVWLSWQVLTGQVIEAPPQLAWIAPAIQVQGWDFVQFVLRQYGARLIYMAVAAIGILLILKHFWQRQPGLRNLTLLVIFIPIGELVGVIFYWLTRLSIAARLLESSVLLTLAAVVIGYTLYRVLQPPGRRRLIRMAVPVVIIALAATLSIFSIYRSPYAYQASPMAVRTDEYGTTWLVDHKKLNLQINGLGLFRSWIIAAVGWVEIETGIRKDLKDTNYRICVRPYHKTDLPSHLGYLNYNSVGDRYRVEGEWQTMGGYATLNYVRYIVVTEAFKIVHSDADLLERRVVGNQEVAGRWDIEVADIESLGKDPAVAKIYSNGGYDVYFVCPYPISLRDPILAPDPVEEAVP